jgi:hypothetical protein
MMDSNKKQTKKWVDTWKRAELAVTVITIWSKVNG